jgi:GTPase SAR1 family protein
MLLKINLGGEASVGKTSFITRQIEDKFIPEFYNTIGLDFFTKELDVWEQKVKMQIWDMSGAERQMKYRKPYFRSTKHHYIDSQAVLLCFALNEPHTFYDIPEWLLGVR